MNVEVESLDKVRKKVQVVLPEEKISELRESIYEELRKKAKIKGFRPGKVPKSIITTYYKDYIEEELQTRMVQSTMGEALFTAKVDPITEPIVNFIDEDERHGYELECEVVPEIELPSYKGVEVDVDAINVTDDDVEKRIDGLQHMHAEMIARESDAVAQKGDFIVIKYQGYMDGKPVKGVGAEFYPVELGSTTLLPEFEAGLIGTKAGEEKDIEITFPEDYPDKDIATKTMQFQVLVKEIKEKRLPEINDEFAKDLNFENLEVMKAGLREELGKEKEVARQREIAQKIMEKLLNNTDVPVPKRLLDKRVQGMIEDAKNRLKADKLSEEEEGNLDGNLRKEFEPRAQERIKGEVVIKKIADSESITVNDDEVHERMKKMAEESRRSYEEIERLYREYNMIDSLRANIMEEKTLNFLRDNAVVKEKQ
jgi:trigger factor